MSPRGHKTPKFKKYPFLNFIFSQTYPNIRRTLTFKQEKSQRRKDTVVWDWTFEGS